MRITILGKSPSWEDAGGACSGYLVEDDEVAVLIDCGNGVFAKLREQRDYLGIDAVVVSHLHADHFLDLIPFAYALTYGPRRGDRPVRPRLHAPAGARDVFRRVVGSWGDETLVESAFEIVEYDGEDVLGIGSLTVDFRAMTHFVPTWAIRVRDEHAKTFVYGADSAPDPAIVGFADRADLLMLEATITRPEPAGKRGHMTPAEAGDHAARAQARRLVLTHISDELDHDAALAAARGSFGDGVEVARAGTRYVL